MALYAARSVVAGFQCEADTPWQDALEASFPYEETPDQLTTIDAVKEDLLALQPMDRLVCGDVGYGKTEVALRAAFKVVQSGRQVAILVPTTVLAQQHFTTFTERLAPYPVRVEMLSRFRSPSNQKSVVAGLASGAVDICIGTHRILQRDVSVKNLGLAVIDEEHKFGVTHKERLKQLRTQVDVLTLSATPIPRTLHMALAGVRDMSTIETPPEERLPIKTYVSEENDELVREAVLRELDRGGQVFYLHNRVRTIDRVAAHIQRLVPEARIGIGHGQMPEDELEKVMSDFSERGFRRAGLHHDHRVRYRPAERQYSGDRPGRHVRAVSALPGARAHRPRHKPGLCLSDGAARQATLGNCRAETQHYPCRH